jgi:hypothetical protein
MPKENSLLEYNIITSLLMTLSPASIIVTSLLFSTIRFTSKLIIS